MVVLKRWMSLTFSLDATETRRPSISSNFPSQLCRLDDQIWDWLGCHFASFPRFAQSFCTIEHSPNAWRRLWRLCTVILLELHENREEILHVILLNQYLHALIKLGKRASKSSHKDNSRIWMSIGTLTDVYSVRESYSPSLSPSEIFKITSLTKSDWKIFRQATQMLIRLRFDSGSSLSSIFSSRSLSPDLMFFC